MSDDLTTTRIRDTLDFQDVKIAALNRGFNMLLNVLVHNKVLNENQELWVDKIKRDQKLAKVIDGEQLMEKLLDICSKLPCPEDVNAAADLVRNSVIKSILPKL